MKILAFCVRPDEESSFKKYEKEYSHEITIERESFSAKNAHMAKGYEGVSILGNCQADRAALEMLKELGIDYLVTRSAGVNNIDLDAAKEFGIKVANVPAYSPNSVGEFAVGTILSLARNFKAAYKRVECQNFGLGGLIGFELRNQTIGVIGTGRIGQATIKALSGFGCKIIAYDLYPNEEMKKFVQYKTLDEVLRESSVITLHCPLTKDNEYLINAKTISEMRDNVVIVNTSRGQLIKTEDLLEGLMSGKIGAAALDVYEHEVGIFHNNHEGKVITDKMLLTLKSLPNVIITPHYAFYTDEAVSNMVQISLANLKEFEVQNDCVNECK